ncbi:hypothetical protein LAZ67_17001510 [Cordylochernes scorpioides]|uniref:Reverse transcriptase domain-containing protein n=1 Tax=Cordylochernes scorpioides TaxID=51811 RepID=A0ABY6LDK9_9ARAC|nr:hypothetical protein LAZ67_17001510 [Cordylochernes scorpioides]
MVLIDVTALYLSLPHTLIIDKLQSFLKSAGIQDQTITLIIRLTSLCLSISTFTFNHQHYKQIRGTPMGSPLSSIAAEVVMGSLDQWINQTRSPDIHYWRRYVDDIFCIITHKPNKLQPTYLTLYIPFTQTLNSHMKQKQTWCYLFWTSSLFALHTNYTQQFITKRISHPYTPISPPIALTLTKRIHTHCSLPIFKAIEKNRITTLLTTAGYPENFIDKHTFDPTAPRTSTIYRAICYLPYSPFSVSISRILRPYGIQVYFNSPPNLAALLRNPITKADTPNNPIHSTGAVYAVSCQDCPASYVGETGRTAYIRITEHKRNINNKDPKSLIYQHISNTGHNFNLDQPKVLYQHINNKQHRLVLESIVSSQTNSINRKIDLPEGAGLEQVIVVQLEGVVAVLCWEQVAPSVQQEDVKESQDCSLPDPGVVKLGDLPHKSNNTHLILNWGLLWNPATGIVQTFFEFGQEFLVAGAGLDNQHNYLNKFVGVGLELKQAGMGGEVDYTESTGQDADMGSLWIAEGFTDHEASQAVVVNSVQLV